MLRLSHEDIIRNINEKLKNNVLNKAQNSNTYFDNLVNNIINKYFYEDIIRNEKIIQYLQDEIIQNNAKDNLSDYIDEYKLNIHIILYDKELSLYNKISLFKKFYENNKNILTSIWKRGKSINNIRKKILDMIKQGIQQNLLDPIIKQINTINYLTILLENMKNNFNNRVKKNNITLTNENKSMVMKQYLQVLIEENSYIIKNISTDLQNIGLPTSNLQNIETWISNQLPSTFFQII